MYRYITSHCARHSSFAENCSDCLKVLNILFLHSIRKFNKREKIDFPLKDDDESKLISCFFKMTWNGMYHPLLSHFAWIKRKKLYKCESCDAAWISSWKKKATQMWLMWLCIVKPCFNGNIWFMRGKLLQMSYLWC